jgi:hypothetical protein
MGRKSLSTSSLFPPKKVGEQDTSAAARVAPTRQTGKLDWGCVISSDTKGCPPQGTQDLCVYRLCWLGRSQGKYCVFSPWIGGSCSSARSNSASPKAKRATKGPPLVLPR